MLIDSHSHLNFEEFAGDWKEVTDDCLASGTWIITVGAQYETSKKGITIAEHYDRGVYASVALHPIHVEGSKFHPEVFDQTVYRELIRSSKKVIAVGETGIDFFHDDSNFEQQKKVFIEHIQLAKEFDLPLIMHGRDSRDGSKSAYQAMLKILDEQKVTRGVIHCFGGTVQDALGFLQRGFYVGFTGIITFDKTGKLAEVIRNLPLDAVLVETDSPYLAPDPYRGKRNQPQYVEYVAKKIAEIKNVSVEEVEEQTVLNTKKLFNLPR